MDIGWYKDNIALQAELRREYPGVAGLIDSLKAELEYTKEMSNAFMDERNNLKIQLAEARAENERIGSVLGLQEYTKHIRQEAIKECLEFIDPITQIHVKQRFGLEGWGMTIAEIYQESDTFFEFPTPNHSHVTTTSAILFAQHIAKQAHREGWEQAKAEAEDVALRYERKVYEAVGDPRVGNFTGSGTGKEGVVTLIKAGHAAAIRKEVDSGGT